MRLPAPSLGLVLRMLVLALLVLGRVLVVESPDLLDPWHSWIGYPIREPTSWLREMLTSGGRKVEEGKVESGRSRGSPV